VSYTFNVPSNPLNRWLLVAAGLVIFGWGPLLAIVVLAQLGLWPDPNPNPVGPGLLMFFTFWPAIICFAIATLRGSSNTVAMDQPKTNP
jgi:hypothetical protein